MIGRTQHFMLFGSKNYHQNISINASTPFYQFFLIDINTDYNIISTITSTFNTNDQIPPSHPHISILGERALLLQTAFTLQEFNLLQRMEKMNAILSAEIAGTPASSKTPRLSPDTDLHKLFKEHPEVVDQLQHVVETERGRIDYWAGEIKRNDAEKKRVFEATDLTNHLLQELKSARDNRVTLPSLRARIMRLIAGEASYYYLVEVLGVGDGFFIGIATLDQEGSDVRGN